MRSVLLALLPAGLLASCGPEIPEYPPEPSIRFVRFAQPGTDSLQVTLHFIDGDGDLGVPEENPDPNLFFYFYHRDPAGNWTPTDGPSQLVTDTLVYTYRVPELPVSQDKVAEGDITVTMDKRFIPNDTISLDMRLHDRAGNRSLWVRTPEVILTR
ncbi:MAG: hypothetical protein FD123_3419 [Bacteroidetes bacterium]|nr:MAG: hypothetical protein FD123_3419 [Bacteroidota bacterium]